MTTGLAGGLHRPCKGPFSRVDSYLVRFVLVLDVLLDCILVQANRAHIVFSYPKAPVSTYSAPPFRVPVKQHQRAFAFQISHYLCYRVFRWYPYAQVDVVRTYIPSTIAIFFFDSNVLATSITTLRHSPYKTFLRYFGIHTMWYVQSHCRMC